MAHHKHSGPDLERAGILRFSCDACCILFPMRCATHKDLEIRERPAVLARRAIRTERVLRPLPVGPAPDIPESFSTPLLRCPAPYEVVVLEIRAWLKEIETMERSEARD